MKIVQRPVPEKKPANIKRTEFRACNGCGALTSCGTCPDCNKTVQ